MPKNGQFARRQTSVDTLASLKMVMSVPAIEGLAKEVITRLGQRSNGDWTAPPDDVRALCQMLCARYPYAADRMVDQLLKAGVPVERIYQDYLAEAARELGARWEKSELTFEEIGTASTRIYMILDSVRRQLPAPVVTENPRIAFAAVPGEQHRLGVKMAVDVFRRAGWDVTHILDEEHDGIINAVNDPDIVLVGLSASGKRTRAALLKLVVALRVVRPDLHILLSGEIAKSAPDFLAQIGIDDIVDDIPTAVEAAERMLQDLSRAPKR